MVPTITAVRMSGSARRAELPLLVLGPSLGTSASALWTDCAAGLTDVFDVIAWDLPGHGHNRAVPEEPFSVVELAAGVLRVVDDVVVQRGDPGAADRTFAYAGCSVGAAVGLQLAVDAPDRVAAAVLVSTAARIGTEASWAGRVGQVSVSGTAVVVDSSRERWFAPGFAETAPATVAALLRSLAQVSAEGYVAVCAALASYDAGPRLAEAVAPLLLVGGAADRVTPPADVRAVADGVGDGRFVELDGVAHLAPAEAPEQVAALVREHVLGEAPADADRDGHPHDDRDEAQHDDRDTGVASALGARDRALVALVALAVRGRDEAAAEVARSAVAGELLGAEEVAEALRLARDA